MGDPSTDRKRSYEKVQGKVIITYARGWQSLAATRSLGRRGLEVVTGDEHALSPASFSRYSVATFRYPSPVNEPERFLAHGARSRECDPSASADR